MSSSKSCSLCQKPKKLLSAGIDEIPAYRARSPVSRRPLRPGLASRLTTRLCYSKKDLDDECMSWWVGTMYVSQNVAHTARAMNAPSRTFTCAQTSQSNVWDILQFLLAIFSQDSVVKKKVKDIGTSFVSVFSPFHLVPGLFQYKWPETL